MRICVFSNGDLVCFFKVLAVGAWTVNSLAAADELSHREVCLPAVRWTSILAARTGKGDVKTRGLVYAVIVHESP